MLQVGDRLRSADGSSVTLTGTQYGQGASAVYNVQVSEYHTYFVGDAWWGFSVWTHNFNCWNEYLKANKGRFKGPNWREEARAAYYKEVKAKKLAPRTVPDVLKDGGKSIGAAGRSRGVRTVGSEKELQSLFDELTTGGTTVPSGTYPGKVVKTPDGSVIRMRPGSKSGGPTIDITGPNGEPLKVHIDPWPPQ